MTFEAVNGVPRKFFGTAFHWFLSS